MDLINLYLKIKIFIRNKLGFTISYLISVLYIVGILYIRDESFSEIFNKIREMPLNELGDFFAGLFGPLAVFWLIMSFRLQQQELRKSSEALSLQAEEMAESVYSQREMIDISIADIKKRNEDRISFLRPIYTITVAQTKHENGFKVVSFRIKNIKNIAEDFKILHKNKVIFRQGIIIEGYTSDLKNFWLSENDLEQGGDNFIIEYYNLDGYKVSDVRKFNGSELLKI